MGQGMDIMVCGGAAVSTVEPRRSTGGRYWQGYADSAMEPAALVDAAGRIACTTAAFDRIAGDGDGVRIAGAIPHARLHSGDRPLGREQRVADGSGVVRATARASAASSRTCSPAVAL